MDETECRANLSGQIAETIITVRKHNPEITGFYALCLQVADDFCGLTMFLNTREHLAKTGDDASHRWEWNGYWSEGIPLEIEALIELHGEVDDFDDEPENDVGPDWLATITAAMIDARKRGDLKMDGSDLFAFCSLSDSDHSPWLEYETAKLLNAPSEFAAFCKDYEIACDGDGYNVTEFKEMPFYLAYKKKLKRIIKG
jgi:hypothetical protein